MTPEPLIFLEHIEESIALIEQYTSGQTRDDFHASVALQDMVIRRLEIIGEAVKNIPESIRNREPDLPWKQYAGLRDKLIHHYFGIDLDLTWTVVEKDIPLLKEKIVRLKQSLSS